MSAPSRRAPTPTFALNLSLAHLCVWLAIPALIVLAMTSSGGPNGLGGFVFLAVIFAFLGGGGLLGALVGLGRAQRAVKALRRGDREEAALGARASVRINAIAGGIQLVIFALSFLGLTKLHH